MNFSNGDRGLLRSLALFLLASTAVLALAGCGIFSPDESNDDGGNLVVDDFKPTGVDDVPPPQGRDNVISNLELTYELLDFPEYEKLFKKIGVTFTRKSAEKAIPFGVGVVIGFSANKGLTWYVGKKAMDFFKIY